MTFSTSYAAKKARIRRLPRFLGNYVRTQAKRDAVGVVKEFQEGIGKNTFNLVRLKSNTIRQKKKKGYRRPATPLYGFGEGKRAYRNMLVIRTRGKSYTVRPSTRRHHEAGISLRTLFEVHEFGAVIEGRGGALIRIPARPAFAKAFARHLRKRAKLEPATEVRTAMNTYINDAKLTTILMSHERNVTREFDE